MQVLPSVITIEILDGIATALLAAATATRAKLLNAPLAGAAAIGCIAGLSASLAREALLHGPQGTKLVISALPDDALIGTVTAFLALVILKIDRQSLFFWLDNASISLSGCLGTVLGMRELGAVGALAIGLVTGLIPSVIRDVSLGDTAMIVEQNWYAAAVFTGAIISVIILLGLTLQEVPLWLHPIAGELAIFGGAFAAFSLRAMKGERQC